MLQSLFCPVFIEYMKEHMEYWFDLQTLKDVQMNLQKHHWELVPVFDCVNICALTILLLQF